MRIAHFVPYFLPDSVGGMELYVFRLCRELLRQGEEVCVVVPTQAADAVTHGEVEGIPVHRFPVRIITERHSAPRRTSYEGWDRIEAFLRAWKPALVHTHAVDAIFQIPEIEAIHRLGSPVIATLHMPTLGFGCGKYTRTRHDGQPCEVAVSPKICSVCLLRSRGLPSFFSAPLAAVPPPESALLARLPWKLGALGVRYRMERMHEMQTQFLSSIDVVVTVAGWAKRVLLLNGAPLDKLVRIETAMDAPPISKAAPTLRPTSLPVKIGYLGRLYPAKGIHVLIQAVRALPSDTPLTLTIYGHGGGEYFEYLQRLVANDSRITFAGAVAPGHVLEKMAEMDVLCAPSTWAEMYPLTLLEARAVGTPVIGSKIGGIPEIIRDGIDGRVFPAGDHKALAAILAEIAQRPAMIDEWRNALRPATTLSAMTGEYRSLYGRTVDGYKRGHRLAGQAESMS